MTTPRQPILVTGGTGTLGRPVVARLRAAGCEVRVLTRHARESGDGVRYLTGDLSTGEGVADATDGVGTIVHAAGTGRGDEEQTRGLVRAVRGRPHLVFISVVGADRVPQVGRVDRAAFGYFGMKLACERIVEGSGLPWTTLRAAQFHDLLFTVARTLARSPVMPLPGGRFQPVEADEVAARLVEFALGEPAGLVADMAGPRVYSTGELVRAYLRATGTRRVFLPIRLPGRAAAAVRAGAVTAPDHAVGKRTWEEFLADQFQESRAPRES